LAADAAQQTSLAVEARNVVEARDDARVHRATMTRLKQMTSDRQSERSPMAARTVPRRASTRRLRCLHGHVGDWKLNVADAAAYFDEELGFEEFAGHVHAEFLPLAEMLAERDHAARARLLSDAVVLHPKEGARVRRDLAQPTFPRVAKTRHGHDRRTPRSQAPRRSRRRRRQRSASNRQRDRAGTVAGASKHAAAPCALPSASARIGGLKSFVSALSSSRGGHGRRLLPRRRCVPRRPNLSAERRLRL